MTDRIPRTRVGGDIAGLRWTYWTCHFLRWLPLGLALPVLALLPLDRGLGLGQIGVLFGVYNATSALLELPTGTLADVLGNRPVLIIAALLETAFYLGFALAPTMVALTVAMILGGIGRALASGALEAWYVDRVYAREPAADVRPAIGGAMFLTNVAVLIGSGAAVGVSLLPKEQLPVDLPTSALPFALAVLCGLLQIVALLALVRGGEGSKSARAGLAELRNVPGVIRESVTFSVQRGSVRLILITGLAVGVGIGAVEAFWQPALADLLADPSATTTMAGLLVAGSTLVGAIGSLIAARLPAAAARHARIVCGALFTLLAAAIVALAVAPTFAVAATAFLFVYLLLELRAPLNQTLLHRASPAGRRASVLSAYSMSTSAGAVIASFGFGAIVDSVGVATVWLCAAAVVALASVAYLRLTPTPRVPDARGATVAESALPH